MRFHANTASTGVKTFRAFLGLCAAFAVTAGLALADPIQVSEVVAKQNAMKKETPVLPPIAKQAHLSGRVVVELSIAEDGSVSEAKVVSGNPILGHGGQQSRKELGVQTL